MADYDVILRAMKRGKTNAECLAIWRKAYPRSTLTLSTINWYRNKFRAAGHKIPRDKAR